MLRIRTILAFIFILYVSTCAQAQNTRLSGYAERGGQTVITQGMASTTKVQASYPSATVTVYDNGTTTLSTLYSNSTGTPKSNPFTSSTTGYWFFYGVQGNHFDVQFSGGGIVGSFVLSDLTANVDLSLPLTYINPSVTSGTPVIIGNVTPFIAAVPAGLGMVLQYHHFHNTGPGLFYGLQIVTDSDTIDTAAGIAVANLGKSDNIYLLIAGKPGVASAPTGIGFDLNLSVSGGGVESSATNSGVGIVGIDWSTTDQGAGGPRAIVAKKQGNANTSHWLVDLSGNRNLLRLFTPEGGSYSGANPILSVENEGATKFYISAGGGLVHAADTTQQWLQPSGNTAFISGTSAGLLDFRCGLNGYRWLNNAQTFVRMGLTDAGALTVVSVSTPSISVTGLIDYADNAAALAAGLTAGAFYRTGDVVKVVH